VTPAPRPARAGSTPDTRWSPLIALSIALHLIGFGLVIGLPRLLPRGPNGPPIYVVDLVSLPAGPLTASPPAGGAARRAEPPPPKPEKAIKLPDKKAEPRQPAPKPTPRPTPEPKHPSATPTPIPARPTPRPSATPPAPASETASEAGASGASSTGAAAGLPGTGSAADGGAGGTGQGAGQADATTFYANLLKTRIENAWNKPIFPPAWTSSEAPTAAVRIGLSSSGRVTGLELVSSSGYDAMDRSITRAVQDAQPFPPFPFQLGRETLTVTITFTLPQK
jgi:TonB family protein